MTAETTFPAVPIPEEIRVAEVARPDSVEEIAAVLHEATEAGRPVLPFGGGTALLTGNRTDEVFLGLDLRGLRGVREYQPADLTASFWAGTTVREVVDVLAEHGQELPLDLPQAERATIGGLVATGFAGPRRLGSGTLKDLLIGCGYVRSDGLAAKAGGMLVKNVSGFEIPRLLHGSWGALAVITSVNLKVVPKPKADATLSRRFSSLEDALAAQDALLQAHATLTACVVERGEDGWALHARLTGREASLRAQSEEIRGTLGGEAVLTEGDGFWREHAERWTPRPDTLQVVIGTRPQAAADVARAVASWPGIRGMTVSAGTGGMRVRLDPRSVTIADLATRTGEIGSARPVRWLVEAAPPAWKHGASVWGEPPDGLALMRAIKQEFDPAGILNRGRLFIGDR